MDSSDEVVLPLSVLLGQRIEIALSEQPRCRGCAAQLNPTLSGRNKHYCFSCATTLARCDLCFVSPEQCHAHLGTCREPQWSETACMVPHTVYLANTSGPKVGITRTGREHARWIDQGACSATPILHAPTRRAAGWIEHYFKRRLNDKTDWRGLVSRKPREYDLQALARQLRRDSADLVLPMNSGIDAAEWAEVRWLEPELVRIEFPQIDLSPAKKLTLSTAQPIVGGLVHGAIGAYLMFEHGVLNLSEHQMLDIRTGQHMQLDVQLGGEFGTPSNARDDEQLNLF